MATAREFLNVLNKLSKNAEYKAQSNGQSYSLIKLDKNSGNSKIIIKSNSIWDIKKSILDLLDKCY